MYIIPYRARTTVDIVYSRRVVTNRCAHLADLTESQ